MAVTFNPVLDISLEAAEDLSSYQYHFVTLDSDGKVQLLNAAGDTVIGVLQNDPKSGEEASVRVLGVSKVVANDALAVLTAVKAEFVGVTDCGKAADASTDYAYVCGLIIEASSAENDLASVLITPNLGNVIA